MKREEGRKGRQDIFEWNKKEFRTYFNENSNCLFLEKSMSFEFSVLFLERMKITPRIFFKKIRKIKFSTNNENEEHFRRLGPVLAGRKTIAPKGEGV